MKRIFLTLAAVAMLTSCVPLYLPPVPQSAQIPSDVRIVHVAHANDEVTVGLYGEIDGWLAAQWFTASGRELGSHSVWLQTGNAASSAVFPDVAPQAAYIIFTYGENILRVYHK